MREHKVSLLILILALASIPLLASAHVSDAYTPEDPHPNYGMPNYGYPESLGSGDITFVHPYPAASQLTNRERFLLWGTKNGPNGIGLQSHYDAVMSIVFSYYRKYHQVPAELTPDVIAEASGYATADDFIQQLGNDRFVMDMLLNPFTDMPTKLQSVSFEPGQYYIRVLTEQEIKNISSFDKRLESLYYNHRWYDMKSQSFVSGTIFTPVFYVRIYGENQVIATRIAYAWK